MTEQSVAAPTYVRPTRRLGFWRMTLATFIVLGLTAGSLAGWQWWTATRAVASYDPWFASYVDVTATPSYAFESPTTTARKNVVLSFIVAATDDPCEPTWGTAYSLDEASASLDLDRRLARLSQLGGHATISFGGAINDELATGCSNTAKLAQAYTTVIDRYQTSNIDLDIENTALSDSAAGERRAAAIKTVQDEQAAAGKPLVVWLTLPVAPHGLTDDGKRAVEQLLAAGVDLAGVNVMTMEYGESKKLTASMADASIDALNATHAQLAALNSAAGIAMTDADLWSRIGATPMIGQNGTVDEVFGLADARTLNAFAQDKQLGRMSMWSLNRDRACSPNYVDIKQVSDACSGVDQNDQSFSDILGAKFTAIPGSAPPLTGAADAALKPQATTAPVAIIKDNPLTSPYPIWSADTTYAKNTKVVRNSNVYETKWWSLGDIPDNAALQAFETPWELVGPVMATDTPQVQILLPEGSYANWSPTKIYEATERVLLAGVPYQSKWWNQAASPSATALNGETGPWRLLTAAEVTEKLAQQ
ncbi:MULTISPECIES: glycosyl hydrolase family 18 [unclassified Cryobacterium]|uniref:glycosyl hydrolase family 18 n=1 Tax=unclassified Cryobacterium TaxID=2649013 RepID=UPI000CE4B45A|nr:MULTISPECIES: glycosyl hydrolase family 18 [unclassified Cryobacterium]